MKYDILIHKGVDKKGREVAIYLTTNDIDFYHESFKLEYGHSPDCFYAYHNITFNNYHDYTFIAKVNNDIVGFCHMSVDRRVPSNPSVFWGVYIKKDFQNCGIYGILFNARYKYAKNIVHSKLCVINVNSDFVKKVIQRYNFIAKGVDVFYDMELGLIQSPSFYCVL